jgi:DNA-binding NarL/FixJ family response regulator
MANAHKETINIILVDDHLVVMNGVAAMLSSDERFSVVGKALGKDSLEEMLKSTPADIVLLDLFLPKPEGIEIAKWLKSNYPKIKILVLSGNEEEELITAAFQGGASGFVTKNVSREELILAIDTLLFGDFYIAQRLEKKLSSNFVKKAVFGDKFGAHKITGLTPRELEIVLLITDGLSYKEVASQLDLSTRTIETHKNNILKKLELKNTIDLVKYAIKNRLIEL